MRVLRNVTTRFTGSDVAHWRRRVGAGNAAKSGAGISATEAAGYAGSPPLPRTWCPHRGHPCLTAVKASSLPTVVRGVRNIRRTHNRGYDPQLLIRTERPLSREIAKIARRTLARPVSEKIGFPEFARINAETSIDILPSIHPFCPRIGKRHRSPSQARKGRVRPFANAPGKWTAIEVLRRELDAIQM